MCDADPSAACPCCDLVASTLCTPAVCIEKSPREVLFAKKQADL